MNLCSGCGEDFGSVKAFDQHRIGTFAYTFQRGLAMDPPREDGRRCLGLDEYEGHGLVKSERRLWSLKSSLEAARGLNRKLAEASEEVA